MFTPIYDAVRISERESRSALPNAPVIVETRRSRPARLITARRIASEQLHHAAEAIAPARELVDPRFTPDPCTGC